MARPEPFLRRVAANGGWWLAERFALLALTLVTSVVIVRALGPTRYGELSYVLALVGLLAPLAQFGVSGLVARALLEKPGDDAAVLRAALLMRLAGCAVRIRDRPCLVDPFRRATSGAVGRPRVAGGAVRDVSAGCRVLVPGAVQGRRAGAVADGRRRARGAAQDGGCCHHARSRRSRRRIRDRVPAGRRRLVTGVATGERDMAATGPVARMGPLVRRKIAVAACFGYRGGHLPAHRHRAPRAPARPRGGRHLRGRGPAVRGLVHGAGGADGGGVSGALEPSVRRPGLPAQPAGLARCAVRGGAGACGRESSWSADHWYSCSSARHFRPRRPCCRSTSGRASSYSCVHC